MNLAYRDHDRSPVIYCIKEMARRHYDLDVDVLHIFPGEEFEAALFTGACDVIIEHTEYLYAEAARGAKVTFFCAPLLETGLELVVPPSVTSLDDLRGRRIAVRAQGRSQAAMMRLRAWGLEGDVTVDIVDDRDVGRWGVWKRVAQGSCAAAFMSPLYLPEAQAAGLSVLPAPDIDVIGLFSQACLSSFPRDHADVFERYMKAVVHALVTIRHRWPEAMEIALGEPMRLMKLDDRAEMDRRFREMTRGFNERPYPTIQAVMNGYEIAVDEYPSAAGLNPLALWDLHWVKALDDNGFIDGLMAGSSP